MEFSTVGTQQESENRMNDIEKVINLYGIREAVAKKFSICWSSLNGCIYHDHIWGDRRKDKTSWSHLTRIIYECITNIKSGYMTLDAFEVKGDDSLTTKQKNKLLTDDHALSVQSYGYFIISIFNNLIFEEFVSHLLIASQTIITTKEENEVLSSFTLNEKGILKLEVPTSDRYMSAGIKKLWCTNNGHWVSTNNFPITTSEEFLKFEKEHLLS